MSPFQSKYVCPVCKSIQGKATLDQYLSSRHELKNHIYYSHRSVDLANFIFQQVVKHGKKERIDMEKVMNKNTTKYVGKAG